MNYIFVNVYRNTSYSDSSLDGVTSDDTATLVVPALNGNITDEDVDRQGYVVLDPIEPAFNGCPVRFKVRGNDERWCMAGGNFVYTSDSRFSETYGYGPVSVHDRIE